MKWSLQQLHKIQKFPFEFNGTLDFSLEAKSIDDIISVSPVIITGSINRIDDETYQFSYHVKAPMVLKCALTLEPVDYVIDEDYVDIFSTIPDDDYILIEKNTVDLAMVVWSNIIIDKPINVTRPDAYDILEKQGIKLNESFNIDEDEEVISYSDGVFSEDENDK